MKKISPIGFLMRTGLLIAGLSLIIPAATYDAEEYVALKGLSKASTRARTAAVEHLVNQLKSGDVLALPRAYALDTLDLSALPDAVQVESGTAQAIFLGSKTRSGLVFYDVDAPVYGTARPGLHRSAAPQASISNSTFFKVSGVRDIKHLNQTLLFIDNGFKTTQFENSKVYYVRYLNGGNNAIHLDNVGDCKGSKIYMTVEHNYCKSTPSVMVTNARNLFMGVGDTEGSHSLEGCWVFSGCTDVVLFAHRVYDSHPSCINDGGKCGLSYRITGGSGVKFFYNQCIGDPCSVSLLTSSSSKFEIWGGSFEDKIVVSDDAFKVFCTPQVMTPTFNKWTEPAMVDSEVIVSMPGYTVNGTQAAATAPSNAITFPAPPSIPSLMIGALPKRRLPKMSRSWGAELLAAGADPTGSRSSSAAFEKLIATRTTVEIPKGKFLIDRPLNLGRGTQARSLIGAGPELTTLKATGNFPILDFAGPLAKDNAHGALGASAGNVEGQTFEGGSYGINVSSYWSLTPGGMVKNCTFRNQTIAGLRAISGVEFDQVKVTDCQFIGGQYGILLENCMVDKQGYLRNSFKGQSVAGIDGSASHMFAGSIVECRFEDIAGPGVNMGYCKSNGYTPHQSMIDNCVFIDCGNDTAPSVNWSYMESSALLQVVVKLTKKTVPYGIQGTGQIFQRCSVLVEGTGKVSLGAFGVNSPRMVKNCRPTGNILRDCYSNKGGLVFTSSVPPQIALQPTAAGFNNAGTLEWWKAEDPSTIYPWAYPQLIYNCKFGDAPAIGYVLLRTNRKGAIIQQIALQENSGIVSALADAKGTASTTITRHLYDLRGRSVAQNTIMHRGAQTALRAGVYLEAGSQKVKARAVLPRE